MVERRKVLVTRAVGNVAVVYFTDSKILREMQIKWVGDELYGLIDEQHRRHLVVNFQNIQRFSTALLGKLIGLKKKAVQAGGTVKLASIPPDVMEIFEITGLDAAFEIFDDEQTAIKSFGRAVG